MKGQTLKVGRNDPCPCGSGKKYKRCCLDEASEWWRSETVREKFGRGALNWLWCLHCERFFQVKDLRPDVCGGNEGCAFEDCDGAGLGVDIFPWDDWPKQNQHLWDKWPKSVSELTYGMVCSLY